MQFEGLVQGTMPPVAAQGNEYNLGQLIIHLPRLHLLEVGEFRLEMKDSIQ